jgi:hypothetical protein
VPLWICLASSQLGFASNIWFLLREVVLLVRQVELVFVIRYDILNPVTELSFLKSEDTLVDFLLKHDSCIFVTNQLAHPRCKQSLVTELLLILVCLIFKVI